MAEEITKGLVSKRLIQLGYPKAQDEKENGIVWYKEDSYTKYDKKLTAFLSTATKSGTEKSRGVPDFIVTVDNKELLIVFECKENTDNHQTYDNLNDYKNGIGTNDDIRNYCINGALHYAQYLNHDKDVIAIAVSGTVESNMRVTSFVLPQKGDLKDSVLLEDGSYTDTIMPVSDYEKMVDIALRRHKEEFDKILNELSTYAIACANYLRSNGISAKDRAGFISAVVLALTNEDSTLYKSTKVAIDSKNAAKGKIVNDFIGADAINLLKASLKDIWENKDNIPKIKRESLDEYYNRILTKSLLNKPEGLDKKYFKYGNNSLSCCIYSIYENITTVLKKYTELDIMGTFYTVFLRYCTGDAKDKGIVLTPKHITEFFCDLAEHFSGKKLDETTKVLDICCGTGGFLIAALNRMDMNINNLYISEIEKTRRKEDVRKNCLIGVESEPEMFALAYANMRFHGDGKSNLYSCSSLLKDKNDKGIAGKDLVTNKLLSLSDELKKKGDIDIGMINPPYSLTNNKDKSKEGEKQKGQSELDFIYSMLSYLKIGGIGIAIVPISCASNKGKKMREIIMKEHTLLACMSMPLSLFQNSNVGTSTCIMVFKAHIPHKNSDKIVFMSRWLDDGFVTIPHNGRYDKDNKWFAIKQEWLRQLKGLSKSNDTVYLKREVKEKEECLAEAYVETDYNNLNDKNFITELKKYNLFLYQTATLDETLIASDTVYWLLDNYDDFATDYKQSFNTEQINIELNTTNWKEFNLTDVFSIKASEEQIDRKVLDESKGSIPYITRTQNNNGIALYVCEQINRKKNSGNCITVGLDTRTVFFQSDDFYTGQNIQILRNENLNPYNAFFLIGVMTHELYKYSWARGLTQNRLKEFTFKLPQNTDKQPDFAFMENYIKSLPYSKMIK